MKFVIIAAMQEELDTLTRFIPLVNKKVIKSSIYEYTIGDYDLERGIEVIIGISGVGRVASALLISNLNQTFNLTKDDYIINLGTAGGTSKVSVSDIVVGLNCLYGDVNLSVFESKYRYGQMSKCPLQFSGDERLIKLLKKSDFKLKYGDICTNESFMVDKEKCDKLISDYFSDLNIMAFDMESAAYAQSCMLMGNNFLAIRYISDVIGMENQDDVFEASISDADKMGLKISLYLLENIWGYKWKI